MSPLRLCAYTLLATVCLAVAILVIQHQRGGLWYGGVLALGIAALVAVVVMARRSPPTGISR